MSETQDKREQETQNAAEEHYEFPDDDLRIAALTRRPPQSQGKQD